MPVQIKLPAFCKPVLEGALRRMSLRVGEFVPPPPALELRERTLLYFKTEACVACDGLDLFVGQLAASRGLDLRVIDARRGAVPEQGYGGALRLDRDGRLRRAYRVRMFPTLVLMAPGGRVDAVHLGGGTAAQIQAALGLD